MNMKSHKSNVDLICDVAELAGMFERSSDLDSFLQSTVSMVAWHMKAAVCSIYLLNKDENLLTLRATQGLSEEAVGRVSLRVGEGITGLAVESLKAVREGRGSASTSFKYIPGIHEEDYQAFLAVPIVRGLTRIGALVVQDPEPDYFDQNDEKALRAIAGQLATTLEYARILIGLHGVEEKEAGIDIGEEITTLFIRGKAASPGIARGMAFVASEADIDLQSYLKQEYSELSADDFQQALTKTEREIEDLQIRMGDQHEDFAGLIFSAHLLILKDSGFSGRMNDLIASGTPVIQAVVQIVNEYLHLFSSSENERLKEKVQDVLDLGHRILLNLTEPEQTEHDYKGQIVIVADLMPSDVIRYAAQNAEGIILLKSTTTSHITILARSMQIPLIQCDDRRLLKVSEEARVIVDGNQGSVFINPDEAISVRYDDLVQVAGKAADERTLERKIRTSDGTSVRLMANANLLSDLEVAARLGAGGVGLYRSEFPFIIRDNFPTEEEQLRIYSQVYNKAPENGPVVFRTLDIGGDKLAAYFPIEQEANPFMGLRAIRLSLTNEDIFRPQLRAMLRAGVGRSLKIMFPLVSSVDDFLRAKDIVQDCIRELDQEQVECNREPELGMMVEVPSAVEMIDEFCRHADFLSIGTNDLIQYLLAVDRTNDQISHMYLEHHPAVLRAIARVSEAAQRHDKKLSICGEMASHPVMLSFLLGVGIRLFSVDPRLLLQAQTVLTSIDMTEAKAQAKELLSCEKIADVEAILFKE